MNFKGTPGPWERDQFGNVIHGPIDGWGRKESVRVSGVALPGRVTPEYEANTQLVAAAPELLEACLRMRNQLYAAGYEAEAGSMHPTKCLLAQVEAAIAKALGQ